MGKSLIYLEDAIDALRDRFFLADDDTLNAVEDCLCNLSPAQPERKMGKWIDLRHDNCYQCSVCKDYWIGVGGFNYCPNCGADMRKDK